MSGPQLAASVGAWGRLFRILPGKPLRALVEEMRRRAAFMP
jgi:hypothetical protein